MFATLIAALPELPAIVLPDDPMHAGLGVVVCGAALVIAVLTLGWMDEIARDARAGR